MKDSLQKFIDENRQAFDDKQPAESVWNKIHSALAVNQSPTLWNSLLLWRAAAVLFLGLAIYAFSQPGVRVSLAQKKEANMVQGEFKDLENFYSSEIAEKVALIESFDGADENDQFTQDYEKLDAMYQVLKEELKTHPSQKVKDALVLNLLVRIDLLNQQLHKLDNSFKKEAGKKQVSA